MAGRLAWLAGTGVWHEDSAYGPRGPSGRGHHSSRLSRGHAVVTPVDGPRSCPPVASASPRCEHVGVWGHSQGGKSASSLRVSLLAVGEGGVSRLRPRVLPVTSPSPGEQAVQQPVWLEYKFRRKVHPSFLRGQGPLSWWSVFLLRITDTFCRQRKVRPRGASEALGVSLPGSKCPWPGAVHPHASLGWPVKRGQSV